jgi:hypothetical protein
MTTRVDPVHPPYPRPVATGSPFSVMQSLRGGEAWERAGDRGSAAGDIQLLVDIFHVGPHRSLADAEPSSDLGVGVPGRDQAKQVLLPGVSRGTGWRHSSASRWAWCRCGRSSVSTARSRSEKSEPDPRKKNSRMVWPGPWTGPGAQARPCPGR